MAKRKDDKVVKEIIERYGATIDLKASPYLIVEIIRQYGPRIDGGVAASCQPPGGPPKILDPSEVILELRAKVGEVERLSAALQKALKTKAPTKPKATPKAPARTKPKAKAKAKTKAT
jgi:hypothetical protein